MMISRKVKLMVWHLIISAHSTFKKIPKNTSWFRITHPDADDTTYKPTRYNMANIVKTNVINRYNGKRSAVAIIHDFHDSSGDIYDKVITFRVNKIKSFAKAAGATNTTVLEHYSKIGN